MFGHPVFFYVAQSTLRDIRDDNAYVVRKLADGNCWMTSGLKYNLSANSTRVGVNHSTNETFDFNTGSSCTNDGPCIMNGNTVMTEQVTNGGYYYSWYAATAGTGTSSMSSGDATGSICPKGWRLSANYTVNPNKSFGGLTEAYLGFHENTAGSYTSTLGASPLGFKSVGYYVGGSYVNVDYKSIHWSSTANSDGKSYEFYLDETLVYPQHSDPRYFGFSVRCTNI